MPIYEYTCRDCLKEFDALRSMKDADSPIACKYCQSMNTKRGLSLCYAQSNGKTISGSGGGCQGCSSGSCGSCGHSH